jgi:putative hydrolase of the HAD superfamily
VESTSKICSPAVDNGRPLTEVTADLGFDAVLLDAGGVLVLPDPTVLAPLLAPYGGSTELVRHRRAHYAAMAVKSDLDHGEHDWSAYDDAYVRAVGIDDEGAMAAADLLGACRVPGLWRWPIPESLAGLKVLADRGIPLGVVSNASGQIAGVLASAGICQIGQGDGVNVRCVVDSHIVGVAKPDPAIFGHAVELFDGVDRSRIVYVGDSVTIDVRAASAAGLRPVLLDPYDDHVGAPFERISEVADLLALARETVV